MFKIFPKARPKGASRRRLVLQQLEERILWDAALAADVPEEEPKELPADVALEQVAVEDQSEPPVTESPAEGSAQADDVQSSEQFNEDELEPGAEANFLTDIADTDVGDTSVADDSVSADVEQSTVELIIVDAAVADGESLIEEIQAADESREFEVVILEEGVSGVDQITQILNDRKEIDALHIVSHGDDGQIHLGTDTLSGETVDDQKEKVGMWASALSDDADILLYGCDVAATEEGQLFVETFAAMTGADVAASVDTTGTENYYGDWDLEHTVGAVETTSAVAHGAVDGSSWRGILADEAPETNTQVYDLAGNPISEAMLDEDFVIELTFSLPDTDGPGTIDADDVGYGPIGELVVGPGVDLNAITYGGSAVTATTMTWDGTQWVEPPPPADGVGSQWVTIELPFGSVTPAQPDIVVEIDASFNADADLGSPIDISYTGGFQFGCDPLDNPDSDPPVMGDPSTDEITPTIVEVEKEDNAWDGETPTGPNHPVEYTITIDISDGETINNAILTDSLPANAVYLGDLSVTPINGAAAVSPTITVNGANAPAGGYPAGGTSGPDNNMEFVIDLGNVTGTSTSGEYEITYTVYYTDFLVDGSPVIDPATGARVDGTNTATFTGDYDGGTVSGEDTEVIEVESLSVRKSVVNLTTGTGAGGDFQPGDVLEWTVTFNVSDYFAFGDIVIDDRISDGQLFDASFTPTLFLFENNPTAGNFNDSTAAAPFASSNFTVAPVSGTPGSGTNPNAGTTLITFNVSDQMVTNNGASEGMLLGDLFDGDSQSSGSYGVIVFRSVVQENYLDSDLSDSSIDENDQISNYVTGEGDIVETDGTTLTDTDTTVSDDDFIRLELEAGEIDKEIYAVNGVVGAPLTGIQPGDVVTYQLTVELPTANVESMVVSDFLPLPAFDVTELNLAFVNSLNPTAAGPSGGVVAGDMDAGDIAWGPLHNVHLVSSLSPSPLVPTMSVNAGGNFIDFDWGTFEETDFVADPTDPNPVVLDILISVSVQNEEMADGLNLTNQTSMTIGDTFSETVEDDDLVQIELLMPAIAIQKAAVATNGPNGSTTGPALPAGLTFNAPGSGSSLVIGGSIDADTVDATPVDTDVIDVDGGDLVTFAVTVLNTGGGVAHGIEVVDQLPLDFVTPSAATDAGFNLQVWDGTGSQLTLGTDYTATIVGGNLEVKFIQSLDGDRNEIAASDPGIDGDEVFFITYDLEVDNETSQDADIVDAGQTIENTARQHRIG